MFVTDCRGVTQGKIWAKFASAEALWEGTWGVGWGGGGRFNAKEKKK